MAANNKNPQLPANGLRRWLAGNWQVLALPVGLFLLLRTYHTPAFVQRRARFTLGLITRQRPVGANSQEVLVSFSVRGGLFTGTALYPASASGHRLRSQCLVAYDSLNPAINAVHVSVPIPDRARAPANGWHRPPFPVPHWVLHQDQ